MAFPQHPGQSPFQRHVQQQQKQQRRMMEGYAWQQEQKRKAAQTAQQAQGGRAAGRADFDVLERAYVPRRRRGFFGTIFHGIFSLIGFVVKLALTLGVLALVALGVIYLLQG